MAVFRKEKSNFKKDFKKHVTNNSQSSKSENTKESSDSSTKQILKKDKTFSKTKKIESTESIHNITKGDKSKNNFAMKFHDSKISKDGVNKKFNKSNNLKSNHRSSSSKKEETPERGPTKREIREELTQSKKSKKQKMNKTESTTSEKKVNIKETGKKFEKVKSPRPLKKKAEKIIKDYYTTDNINSYLLEAKNSDSNEKVANMLLFILKTFKSNPSEVLAKVKILTSDKRVNTEGDAIQIAVLKHICAFYKLENLNIHGLFKMIETNSLLSKFLLDFVFSAAFDSEQYDSFFNEIFTEICRVSEKSASLSFNDFIGFFYEIDSVEHIENYQADNVDDEVVHEPEEENSVNEHEEDVLPSKETESSDESSVDLVSLNDDDEMLRLDRALGKMFGKGMLSIDEQNYLNGLCKCLELLIKNNFNVKIENLIRILYLCQFEYIANRIKFIVKDFLGKIGDKERIFRIFQISSLINPSVYSLYTTFYSYCNVAFDLKVFLTCVFNFGHEEFIINKIDKDAFYSIYNSTFGKSFDDFLISLIQMERREHKLKEMETIYFNDNVREAISHSLAIINEKQQKKAENSELKEKKRNLNIQNTPLQ